MDTIIGSLISAAVAIAVCLISNHSQNEKSRALIEYKLDQLEKKVDKHNNLVERMYDIEKITSILKQQIENIGKRLDDLESI